MMKSAFGWVLWATLVAAFFSFAPDLEAEPVVLNLNHQFPAGALGSKIDQWFADEVRRATGGEVDIRIFWSGALGAAKENLVLLRSGAVDMAAMSAGYFPSELPFFSAPNSIPMALDDVCQSAALMPRFMERVPGFTAEAEANGVRPLFFHLLNPYVLVTVEPVAGLADLSGKKIRTWGEDMPRLFQAARAVPVTIFLPELYENLQRRVIDGCPFSLDLAVSYRIYEVARNVTEVPVWVGPAWGVWIGEKAWQRLSAQQRDELIRTGRKAREKELGEIRAAETAARAVLEEKGVHFNRLPPDDVRRWESMAPDFFQEWIAKMARLGLQAQAEKAVAIWKDVRQTVSCPQN